jgi:hypothetical protein
MVQAFLVERAERGDMLLERGWILPVLLVCPSTHACDSFVVLV